MRPLPTLYTKGTPNRILPPALGITGLALIVGGHTLSVIAGAPLTVTVEAQTLVTLETVLGPLQAALLALAIRRRFMR